MIRWLWDKVRLGAFLIFDLPSQHQPSMHPSLKFDSFFDQLLLIGQSLLHLTSESSNST